MAANQSWVTYASSDLEGIKALALARSLRDSISRRKLTILISSDISDEICKLLEDEFDTCKKIRKPECERYPNRPFSYVAKVYCWKLQRICKFVFLDCNSIVLKHSDGLFKKHGIAYVEKQFGKTIATLIAGERQISTNTREFGYDTEMEKTEKANDKNDTDIDKKYCVQMNLQDRNFVLTGEDINIIHFDKTHPLEIVTQYDSTSILGMSEYQKNVVKFCLHFIDEDELPCDFQANGNTFQTKLKHVKSLLANSSEKIERPCPKLIEDLKDSVAIVGMGFRLPGANTTEEFWDLLINAKDGIVPVPEGRWGNDRCFDRGENFKETPAGFLKCPIDMFDGKFFGINAAELAFMDPQQRLTLQVVWESLENAGISGTGLKDTLTGVFGGWWRNDYKEMLQEAGLNESEFFRAYMGNALGTLTGRISHFLELTGPSISTESGCSTSIVAVDMACNSLRDENCDLALAVGVNLLVHPFNVEAMNSVVAPDGHCKTFDANADGFGRAEGCAVLVLKRFADAAADGDKIWGVIRGSAVVQEGASKSLGTPTVQCEALAMELALKRAGVQPYDVSYVETHGTGTPVGDPLEVAAVAKIYSHRRKDILTIGSVKTNIGHTESVSGIAGIVKTVLSLHNEMIPAHCNMETLNPEIFLDSIPAQIPMSPLEWKKVKGRPRIAGVSSFGITGTDAHLILQENPDIVATNPHVNDTIPKSILTISAKSPEALEEYIETYKNYLQTSKEQLEDITYTTNLARGHFSNRLAVYGESKNEVIEKLEKRIYEKRIISHATPKICFLFTGQGSQYPGMAQDLYENSLVFKSHFDMCDNILLSEYGFSIKHALWESDVRALKRTLYSQTSIFVIEFCLLKLWESWGVNAQCVVGHSLGEFAAAIAAGILNLKDAITLVVTRSKLIDLLPGGKMLVIKAGLSFVEKTLKTVFQGTDFWLDIAAVNTLEQTVLAGDEAAVDFYSAFCQNNQIKSVVLDASHAFHSRHMDPVLEKYRATCSSVLFSNATCNFISGVDGKLLKHEDMSMNYWVRHTREKVSFMDASKAALENGCTHFVEVGPQPVLSSMILINSDNVELSSPVNCLPSIRKNEKPWETMMTTLSKLYTSGVYINWENYHRYSNAKKVDVPSYPFQLKPHWMEIINNNESVQFHPLVGSPVPNASALKIFRSDIDIKKIAYLSDHVIGNSVVFPGAGFLEMCIVAGHSAIQCTETMYFPPTCALTIDDFKIESPLGMNEDSVSQLQTIVSVEDTGETNVTIYSKLIIDKDTYKWIKHASCVFTPFQSKYDGQEEFMKDSLENIISRCTTDVTSNFSYKTLAELGIKFGPTFQTVKEFWVGENEAYFKIEHTINSTNYILHPLMIDSMFQALMVCVNPEAKRIHVPISISKFIAINRLTTETCYIHCKQNISKEYTAIMLDSSGQQIAVMIGAEFMETTVANVISLIDSQKNPLPSIYETVWREQLGPLERRTPPEEFKLITEHNQKLVLDAEMDGNFNRLTADKQYFYDRSYILNGLYMIKALQQLDLNYPVDSIIDFEHVAVNYKIQRNLCGLLRFILVEQSKDGYFQVLSKDDESLKLKVLKNFPPKQTVLEQIDAISNELRNYNAIETDSVSYTANCLAEILQGKVQALPILFHENGTPGPAESLYKFSEINTTGKNVAKKVSSGLFQFINQNRKTQKNIIRILEVGSGTGSYTEVVLKDILADGASHYEYTYTDVSPAFFQHGKRIFENSKMRVNYKVLNIEEDPLTQGFIANHYDMIFASFVIHATTDIRKSMLNIKTLLRDGGLVLVTELIKPHRSNYLVFATLDGFWKFTDTDLRPHTCEMDVDKWETVFRDIGLQNVSAANFYNSHCAVISGNAAQKELEETNFSSLNTLETSASWVIFSDDEVVTTFYTNKLIRLGRHVTIVNSTNYKSDNNSIKHDKVNVYSLKSNNIQEVHYIFESLPEGLQLEGVIYLWGLNYNNPSYEEVCHPFMNICKSLSNKTDVKLFVFTQGACSLHDCSVALPLASPIISMANVLQNENSSLAIKCVDLEDGANINSLEEGFSELFTTDGEFQIAFRNNRRIVPRFISMKVLNNALKFPKSGPFKLILPQSRAVSDVRFGSMELPLLKDNQVQIKVKAFGLNFRDLFTIMKPDPAFESFNTVGIDYSGIVTAIGRKVLKFKVGDAAFGINLHGVAMPSHVQLDENLVIPLSSSMTFGDGATLPAVAATAYICLIELAKLQKNDTILIHAASGGVGLCAIQIAKSIGCTIVATAGSRRKRTFLQNLGLKYVFHSRNTSYENDIRKALNGNGVNVVLNSLTGEGFKEASLAICNKNARFIEMSKLNIWSHEEVQSRRPDVRYETIDLSQSTEESTKKNMQQIKAYLKESTLNPIPYVRFDAAEIREALGYLQEAKHIGKVVCMMPEDGIGSSDPKTFLFNGRSSYMITGGLGGIGLEVAKWMANSGAKHIILVGRNPPKEVAAHDIQKLVTWGINVRVVNCDVGDRKQCSKLLETIKCTETGLPPLRGIMHAAGVLCDATYDNQTWEKFETCFNPKVRGSWNLHELTIDYHLEHFVTFSSITGILGSMGQSNHSAANYFLDSLAHYRNSIGLPAMTVNWGQWGQVGVAGDIEVNYIRPFTALQGISALERLMKTQKLQTSVIEANISVLKKLFVSTRKYFEEIKAVDSTNKQISITNSDTFWKNFDQSETREAKYEVLEKFLCELIRSQTKLDETEILNGQSSFQQDLGMDSLMMIEMKNELQSSIGKRVKLTVTSLNDCKTIAELSNGLLELISGVEEIAQPTQAELIKLIKEDSILPDDIKPVAECTIKPSEIKTVLLTGVTGNFGAYVLRELLKRPTIQKVYCLMRDSRMFSPADTLKSMLTDKKMISKIDMTKVECVSGDVTKPLMGLSQDTYEKLATNVDAIFNLSVKAAVLEYYCKSETLSHSRNVNVGGTKKALKFACHNKTKHVFHASTMIATTKADSDGSISETWPVEGEFDNNFNSGYPISKYCCDLLMAQAVERGIPCKVFRFPFMSGDSKLGGNISVMGNHMMMRMLVYMRVGKMPAVNVPLQLIPVNTCAEMSLNIFFNDDAPFEMYNVSNPYAEDELLLEDVAEEFGYKVEAVEQEEFFETVEKLEGNNLREIKDIVKSAHRFQIDDFPSEYYVAWLSGNKNAFLSKKLLKYIPEYPTGLEPSWNVLKRDLYFARENGDFAKLGLIS